MAAKRKTVEGAPTALTELQAERDTLQEQFNTVVEQRDTLRADRDTMKKMVADIAERQTLIVGGAHEALAALDYAIGKGLIRAGSPMDKHFDNLRLALKSCSPRP